MRDSWKKLRVLVGIIIAMSLSPLYAMEVLSEKDKNQLCGIDKLIHNRWAIDQAYQNLFEDNLSTDIKNEINRLEFSLIFLFKFRIPSANSLIGIANSLENNDKYPLECVSDFDKNKIYHKIYTKTEGLSLYLECINHCKKPEPPTILKRYPTISKENLKLKDIKIGEGKLSRAYHIVIQYANNDCSNFSVYCDIPYLYGRVENPFHIHDLDFYILNPGKTPLDKTEKWKVYKKSDYKKREFYKLTPLEKSLFVEYALKSKKEKEKKTFGRFIPHFFQEKKEQEKNEEIDDAQPEDFYIYFLKK